MSTCYTLDGKITSEENWLPLLKLYHLHFSFEHLLPSVLAVLSVFVLLRIFMN